MILLILLLCRLLSVVWTFTVAPGKGQVSFYEVLWAACHSLAFGCHTQRLQRGNARRPCGLAVKVRGEPVPLRILVTNGLPIPQANQLDRVLEAGPGSHIVLKGMKQ